MKKIRSLPFGYELRNGKIEIAKNEARVLRRIYQMYTDGGSLNSITTALEKQGIPYSSVDSTWSKHKVKYIIENPRYIGQDGFPAILEEGMFRRVRELYTQKTQAWHAPVENPEKQLWKRLICAECGSKLKRIGGGLKKITLMECDGCGARVRFETDALLHTLSERLKEATSPAQEPAKYQPTQELMRLENEIERRIEKPSDGNATRRLILEAAAKRYTLCPDPIQESKVSAEDETDWKTFKEAIDAVLISGAGEIHIRLKSERT